MKRFLFFLFLSICISTNAQIKDTVKVSNSDSVCLSKLTGEAYYEFIQYVGDQFYNTNWTKSDILLANGTMLYDIQLKYNGFLDEVIWMNTNNLRKFKLDKSSINDFWLKNSTTDIIHFKRINVTNTNNPSTEIFVEVGIEGKLSLYIQHKIKIDGEEDFYLNGHNYLLKSIGPKPLYYINLQSNNFAMLDKINRINLLKLFPEHKIEIQKIMRLNHLNLKTPQDLIKLIDLLNKIL